MVRKTIKRKEPTFADFVAVRGGEEEPGCAVPSSEPLVARHYQMNFNAN